MKKNKLYLFIILIIAALIFGVAFVCTDSSIQAEMRSDNSTNSNVTSDSAETQSNITEPKPDLIHGVVPTSVDGFQRSNFDNNQDVGKLEFNNVGKLGGEQYSKAKYTTYMQDRVVKTFEGYFTGGPDGEIFLTGDGILGNNAELHGKLVDGKEFILDDGTIFFISNPKAFEGWVEDEAKEVAPDAAEPDANLHGLVPTKVSVHTHQATDDKDSYSDHYIEFWNIGKLGGEQYAKATDQYVATRDGAQSSEIIFEGTFTGGPNGLIEMSAVSSSGNDEGSTAKMVLQLIDGKQLQNPSNGYMPQIVNPEALVGAFDGWKD
jgi:hypothetical protein